LEQEAAMVASLGKRLPPGEVLTARRLLPALRRAVGREVCPGTAYAILRRHSSALHPEGVHPNGST
jgi:hypothetical protein